MPLTEGLELSEEQTKEFKDIFRNLVTLFFEKDLSLVEINPLVLNGSDNLVCLDGKINIDSNALFRQDEILELRDISQEEEKELRASEHWAARVKMAIVLGSKTLLQTLLLLPLQLVML